MPNRIFKESICTSEDIAQLAPMEEIFFYRLIVNCDDYGRQDGRPSVLRARCFPLLLSKVSDAMVSGYLHKLAAVGMVRTYQAGGKDFVQVCSWDKHQQIRAKYSKFPAPDSNGNQLISDVPVVENREIEIEKEVEIKKESTKEKKYEVAEGVFLTTKQVEELMAKFGEDGANERITAYSEKKLAKGYKYVSDYHAMLTWERKNEKENSAKRTSKPITQKDPDHYIKGKYGHMVAR
jgi:hypothetical protein